MSITELKQRHGEFNGELRDMIERYRRIGDNSFGTGVAIQIRFSIMYSNFLKDLRSKGVRLKESRFN